MDNIGDITGLVVTGIHRPHRWRLDSYFAGHSCDRLDI